MNNDQARELVYEFARKLAEDASNPEAEVNTLLLRANQSIALIAADLQLEVSHDRAVD